MRVLAACEESQAVANAFREKGFEAYSCDLEPCGGGHPEYHIQADALEIIKIKWDLIIAFPPCTFLSCVGAPLVFNKDHSVKDVARYEKGKEAALFFKAFLNADCQRIAVENPRQLHCFGLPNPDQFIEPFMFGEPWRKKTGLWLKGLPKLEATKTVDPLGLWVGTTSGHREHDKGYKYILHGNRDAKRRSRTFHGVAEAMATQWGDVLRNG